MNLTSVIAAVRSDRDFEDALQTSVSTIFQLVPHLMSVASQAKAAHQKGKTFFVHLDLAEGIAKDRVGIRFLKRAGVDGVISTRQNLIKLAREEGLLTVQRFFALDSRSVETIVESVKSTKADMIEVMPGVVPKVIRRLCTLVDTPIIAGGLVETLWERDAVLENGGRAVSTGNHSLWEEAHGTER